MIDKTPYTPGMREVLKLSKAEAGRLGHDYIGPEHYLLGIIRKGDGLAVQTLTNLDIDLGEVKRNIEQMLEIGKNPTVGLFSATPDAKRILDASRQIATEMKHGWVGTEHLLLALVHEEGTLVYKCLTQMGLTWEQTHKEVTAVIDGSSGGIPKTSKPPSEQQGKTPALDMFGRDLTVLAREGKLDPVIGRKDEIERIFQILCRRTKNNPILIGEPGVGKTAIVEGLAQRIVNDDIPDMLRDRRLLSLDLAAMVAGTKYRGQFEERLKAVMQEIKRNPEILLFIDEMHTLIGAGAAEGAIDAASMLKPALSRGEIQCIGATTLEEYRKYIEKDGAFERRFQPIVIQPPSLSETTFILRGLRNRYEQHHSVVISDEGIEQAIQLAERYVTDRKFPDKAIDVIDEAAARVRLLANARPEEIGELGNKITECDEQIRILSLEQNFEQCQLVKEEKERLQQQIDASLKQWRRNRTSSTTFGTVGEKEVSYIVSKWTGIPVMRMEEEETQRLLRMEEELGRRVVSQTEAIEAIAKAIRRSRSGLKDPKRPSGSFMFLGPTGVGKTELAKTLAEFLFGNEEALIRIDMSEYMEKYSVSRLLGAPPGYVGYEEGGQLTEKVRKKPYSVVLLDEIEKAHPDVFSLLLQVFDDGRLTDSWGHVVDFRNTVLILTSNVGTRRLTKSGSLGFNASDAMLDHAGLKTKVLAETRKMFNPEFLNRLDEIIVFHSLTREDIEKIVEILLDRLNDRLADRGIVLNLTQEAREFLVTKGYDSEYGARPMRRAIQKYIEDELSVALISGSIPDGADICCTVKDTDSLTFDVKIESPQEAACIAKGNSES